MGKIISVGPYSAYGIAVKHGYEGTEEEWISSVERDRIAAEKAAKEAKEFAKADPTLTISGAPADAKAVGDRINAIRIETDKTLTISGAAADAAATGVRIKMLEMVQGMDVNGISFVSTFGTLEGVELTGVWNKAASRVDF